MEEGQKQEEDLNVGDDYDGDGRGRSLNAG